MYVKINESKNSTLNVYLIFKQSYQCAIFYIKTFFPLHLHVCFVSQQVGTERSVSQCVYHLKLDNILCMMCLCFCAVAFYPMTKKRTRACTVNSLKMFVDTTC